MILLGELNMGTGQLIKCIVQWYFGWTTDLDSYKVLGPCHYD
jgi:hypothetical protein